MLRPLFLFLVLLLGGALRAQGLYDRKHPEIFPTDGKMRRDGFYFAPGLTWTLANGKGERELFQAGDSSYKATFDPKGALGLYLEAGWFRSTADPVILDYWDFGVAYKQLKGSEAFAGTLVRGDSTGQVAGDGAFNDQHVTVHVNANKLFQTADYQFIQFSLGANVDYRFGTDRTATGVFEALNKQAFPPDLIGQVHVKLGYGFRINKQLMVIPAVETPIFSVQPTDDGRFGAMQWFSSDYRPLILSVRFLFLRYPKGWACPPVKNNEFERHKVVNPSYEPK
ncbi:MAG: hypothetical protein QM724_06075 [Flavobacteriales bacterium]